MKTQALSLLLLLPIPACSAPHLHPKIVGAMDRSGSAYLPPEFCGNVVRIREDPRKIADGSPSYFDNTTGNLIVSCPNPMIRPTVPPAPRVCPPVQWKCGGVW